METLWWSLEQDWGRIRSWEESCVMSIRMDRKKKPSLRLGANMGALIGKLPFMNGSVKNPRVCADLIEFSINLEMDSYSQKTDIVTLKLLLEQGISHWKGNSFLFFSPLVLNYRQSIRCSH
jgi:hypothetical protein